jgi:hypothetical protein
MVNEDKIEGYQVFYNTIVKYLKLPDNRIDWSILKKHQGFIGKINEKTVDDDDIKAVQKELSDFIKTLTRLTQTWLICFCANHNTKIDLKEEPLPKEPQSDNILLQVVVAMSYGPALALIASRKLRRELKNTFEALLTIKRCLDKCGLIIDEINKRPDMLYNFVLIDKTEVKKQSYAHYFITKAQLEVYVNANNSGQHMRIDGKFFKFSPITDITITATKFKNVEEIDLYKKLERIRNDAAFAKSAMCTKVTNDFIPSNVPNELPKPVKSIHDLIETGKIKDAISLASYHVKSSTEDKDEFTLLTSRLSHLESEKRKGLVKDDAYISEFNRIKNSLIEKVREWDE